MFKIDKRLTASAVALFVLAGPQVQAGERTQTTTTFDRSGDKDPATNKGGYDDQVLTGIATPNRRAGGKTPQGLTTKKDGEKNAPTGALRSYSVLMDRDFR